MFSACSSFVWACLMDISDRSDYFRDSPDQSDEATVRLLVPRLLKELGVEEQNFVPEYKCDQRAKGKVDFAAKFNSEEEKSIFYLEIPQ